MSNAINEVGNRYGKLTVIEQSGRTKNGQLTWLCKCDCGKEISTRGCHLRGGLTKECSVCALKSKPYRRKRSKGVTYKMEHTTVYEDEDLTNLENEICLRR